MAYLPMSKPARILGIIFAWLRTFPPEPCKQTLWHNLRKDQQAQTTNFVLLFHSARLVESAKKGFPQHGEAAAEVLGVTSEDFLPGRNWANQSIPAAAQLRLSWPRL